MDKWSVGEDPGSDWRDLDDVGPVVKGRIALYREYGLSMEARASVEHALLWAANANSNGVVFWMLERIYSDKALLALLREEIEPYVRAVQPKQEFIVPDAPRLEKVDVDGLCANCPLLKSCYIEVLRLDAASWSLKVAKQDFVLTPRDKEAQSYQFRKGEYMHVAHDLYNTDPNAFENPDVFKADRHVKYDENGKGTADMGSMRPYGMSSM
jgi:cytochrome P450